MQKIIQAWVMVLSLVAVAAGSEMEASKSTGGANSEEYGVYVVPIKLSPGLETRRKAYAAALLSAQRRVVKFAKAHGWEKFVKESFFDQAEFFDSRDEFIAVLAETYGVQPEELRKGGLVLSGVLENRRLMAVTPKMYNDSYPDGREKNAYEKLLAHEIFHRLHVRILGGNENAMGPVWFFEGFAIYAADQFSGSPAKMTDSEIMEVLEATGRGSYKKYSAVMRRLTSKIRIESMVSHASDKDFIEQLKHEAFGKRGVRGRCFLTS